MASGNNLGRQESINAGCIGQTGLSYQSYDEFEQTGCKYDSDNFLKYLSVDKGEKYLLLINNYDSQKGLSITFDGDCELMPNNNCKVSDEEQPLEISSIVPNPATKKITVNFLSSVEQEILTEVFTIRGKRLHKSTLMTEKGMNKNNWQ
ncbi:MAG: hypothetical protein RLZZ546_226 [Bacteroidota bacterium]|jgi:hypothetical protein